MKKHIKKLLTSGEKQYLKKLCNYLGSVGLKYGEIEFQVEDNYDGKIDYEDINWDYVTTFSNNHTSEIPSGLIPILQKIMKYASDESLFSPNCPDPEEIIWQSFSLHIGCANKEIELVHYWSYHSRGDGQSVTWDDEDGAQVFDELKKEGLLEDMDVPQDGMLTISYNGSGDSGYLEDFFNENHAQVPGLLETWCYRQLSENFGGWEINEGSDGVFEFDFNNKTIVQNHAYNVEETNSDTLWEEEFGLNEK